MVMCLTAQPPATAMKADEAMLLSTLYQLFVDQVYTKSRHYPCLHRIVEISHERGGFCGGSTFTSVKSLLLLVSMSVICYGTLLFHKKCDLVKALSAALGKGRTYSIPKADGSSLNTAQRPLSSQRKINVPQNTSYEEEKKPECSCSIEDQIPFI